MKTGKAIFLLSLLLSLLVIIANVSGLLFPDVLYAKETANWYAQCIGQDIADLLFALPALVISSLLTYRQNKKALLVWAGTLAYLIYTFTIYSFAVQFNSLFIVYCLALGLSVYLLLWFLLTHFNRPVHTWFDEKVPAKGTGWYLIIIACLFYLLWLSAIIPAIAGNRIPEELAQVGLPANPVHVIDLSVCLPGIFITGILLLKRHRLGYLLAPAVLTFFVIMDLSLGSLMIVIAWRGLASNPVLMGVMFALAVVSFVLLFLFMRSVKDKEC
ncbi:MAG: hypothetical protein JNN00_01885 [Chitinophagaceae bacterium]|nr:hypothetical protein [Chitinophagaceae bacterium]